MSKSTRSRRSRKSDKPAKPYPDFPLFPHATRRWAKKIRGRLHYFGPWADPTGAEARYKEQAADLHAGRTPRPAVDGFTVKDAANAFLNFKRGRLDTGELSLRSFGDYLKTCVRLVDFFGKARLVDDLAARDFEQFRASLAKTLNVVSLGNEIQRVRMVFRYCYETALIPSPVRFGPGFARPSKKSLRIAKAANGSRMLEAPELRKIIDTAGVPLKAFVLLALNCGYGNSDISCLPLDAIDLGRGWINFPRPKTGAPRRCPLWPETIRAVRDALAVRPQPRDAKDKTLAFLTRFGGTWVKAGSEENGGGDVKVTKDDALSKEFSKVLRTLGLKRRGLSFYSLRHVHRTISDESLDTPASNYIMGHIDTSMAAVYVERISDARLQAVVDHVHGWLFSVASKP
jgi:integrase